MNFESTQAVAKFVRRSSLKMVAAANASHIGSCLSIADILAVLYQQVLQVRPDEPSWVERDRLILSKGHAAAALYSVLAAKGFFPVEWLEQFCCDGSPLQGHANSYVPGVELSTGSLGHGLPVACGMALAAKRDRLSQRVYCILSDGELDEGSNWEAILFAAHHQLDNLTAIVDRNGQQGFGKTEEIIRLEPVGGKWSSFGWAVEELDGHDHGALAGALNSAKARKNQPTVLIAHTIKGKGVSYMEGTLDWHYKSPTSELLEKALAEIVD